MLVESPQRGLGACDDLLHREVGASGFAQYRDGRLDKSVGARYFGFLTGVSHEPFVPFPLRSGCASRMRLPPTLRNPVPPVRMTRPHGYGFSERLLRDGSRTNAKHESTKHVGGRE